MIWQRGYAIPERRTLRGERGGWKGDSVRQSTVILTKQLELESPGREP